MQTHSLIHSRLIGSGVGWPRVNLTQFPRYQHAKGWAYTVNAGDTLYIPAYWWHWVRSEGAPAVAVNVWTVRPYGALFAVGEWWLSVRKEWCWDICLLWHETSVCLLKQHASPVFTFLSDEWFLFWGHITLFRQNRCTPVTMHLCHCTDDATTPVQAPQHLRSRLRTVK
jgi:hypothetical protein